MVANHRRRAYDGGMEQTTPTETKKFEPGPYLLGHGEHVVYLGAPPDDTGRLLLTDGKGDVWYRKPSSLTPADRWPDWWPWPDMALPERPLQVGDFVISPNRPDRLTMIIGMYGGKVQCINQYAMMFDSHVDELERVERPDDWPFDLQVPS